MNAARSRVGIRVVGSPTGNVPLLLNEICHAVERLLEAGESHVIDLRALPLGPGESEQIEQALGRGEVEARLQALGPTEILETRYPGVWLVTHFNTEGETIGRLVEIAPVPVILEAPDADVRDGLRRLRATLKGVGDDYAQTAE